MRAPRGWLLIVMVTIGGCCASEKSSRKPCISAVDSETVVVDFGATSSVALSEFVREAEVVTGRRIITTVEVRDNERVKFRGKRTLGARRFWRYAVQAVLAHGYNYPYHHYIPIAWVSREELPQFKHDYGMLFEIGIQPADYKRSFSVHEVGRALQVDRSLPWGDATNLGLS